MKSSKNGKHTRRPKKAAKPVAKRKAAPKPVAVLAASLSAAAAMLECHASVLKRAKKAGAPGFRANGSVCINELKPWLLEHAEDVDGTMSEKEELECRRLVAQCEKLEFANEVERGNYTHNDLIQEQGMRIGAATRTELLRFKADIPNWAGLTSSEMERRVTGLIAKVCESLNNALSKAYGK